MREKNGERENTDTGQRNVEKNGGDINVGWPTLLKHQ
jgi:hypothetical protein